MTEKTAALAATLAPRLALLKAIADEGHLTRAAQRIGIPQPTASRWVAALATQVGAPVVARDGRGIRLTRIGEHLADAAGQALAVLADGCRPVVQQADPERGLVVFGFLPTMGESRVPALLRAFRAHHPHIQFTLRQGAHRDTLDWVRTGQADLALTSPLPTDPALTTVWLAEQELVLTVPTGHRLAGERVVPLSDLAGEPFVGLKPGYGLRRITEELCAGFGYMPVILGEECDTLRGLVAAGLGVAILPASEHDVVDGTVELRLRPAGTRQIGLVWPADDSLPPAARAFRDFVLTTVSGAQRA